MPKSIISIVIICITIGWFLGLSTAVGLSVAKTDKESIEPVVCLVEMRSGPKATHTFKGVQK